MKRIFFGGTFDPIHIGHTRLALECQQQLAAPLTFVPCGDPLHKAPPLASKTHRLAMIHLAAAELNMAVNADCFFVEPMEIYQEQPSFTVATLQILRQRYPHDILYWLIGMDSLVNLASWHRWQELTEFANLLVVNRPEWQLPAEGAVASWLADKKISQESHLLNGKVLVLYCTPLNIASSTLREQLRKNDAGKFLLPESVRQYVTAQRLYHSIN